MAATSIATAIVILTDLLQGLEDAYWESSSIEHKDAFFDLITAVYQEQTELAKLSIQDHDLEYEPISGDFRRCRTRLSELRKTLDESVARSNTVSRLEEYIGDSVGLFTH